MEIDIDDEIENVKSNYENELKSLNEYAKQITINVCQEDFRKVNERYSKKGSFLRKKLGYYLRMKTGHLLLISIFPALLRVNQQNKEVLFNCVSFNVLKED
jgi:uncharacterized membrane protein YgaE (UPF0421/DUF939 family)